jgi:hypothetical protein
VAVGTLTAAVLWRPPTSSAASDDLAGLDALARCRSGFRLDEHGVVVPSTETHRAGCR